MSVLRSLGDYYRRRVGEARRHFDLVETTVSHLFREPHPALDGRTYGGAFRAALDREGYLERDDRVLEIGGGTGCFARGFAEEGDVAGAAPARPGYWIADLAPSLIEGQRRELAGRGRDATWIRCDAQRVPLATGSWRGVVVSNEVIADFDAVRIDGGRLRRSHPVLREAAEVARRYDLEVADLPARRFLNLGAIRLVEELARVLAPGGRAAIAEYGRDAPSEEAVLYDGWFRKHTEYSIDFRHLRRVGTALGLEVEERNLHDFLGFRDDVSVLNYTEVRRLKMVRPDLEVKAWTEEALREAHPDLLETFAVRFRTVGDAGFPDETPVRHFGGFRGLFRVLLLTRPASS